MKRIFSHPEPAQTGRAYWRSLEEAANTPEFQERLRQEFPAGAAEFDAGGVSRRDFLKLMGAGLALAGVGTAACRRPEGQLVPYTKSPEWIIPGRSLFYASAMPRRGGALPLVVTTFEGRPTHLDGNKLVPGFEKGSTDTHAQASILDMYDPDRLWNYQSATAKDAKRRTAVSTADFVKKLKELAGTLGAGQGAALLLEPSSSPSQARVLAELRAKFPQLLIAEYTPLPDPTVLPLALGPGVRVRNNYAPAKRILALDSDFFCGDDTVIQPTKEWADGHRIDDETAAASLADGSFGMAMNRLYAVEAAYTTAGAMADHRLRLAPSQCLVFAQVFAQELVAGGAAGSLGAILGALPPVPAELPFNKEWAVAAAKDFLSVPRGQSIFVVGPRQPEIVRLLGLAINEALGNIGATVKLLQAPVPAVAPATIQQLAQAIGAGSVNTLFVLGGNPVYNAPSELKWAELQAKVPTVVRLGFHDDETTALSDWIAPLAHYLESWGDDFTIDGTYVSVQPMILPINDGVSELEFLTLLNGGEITRKSDIIRPSFDQLAAGGVGEGRSWTDFLRNGFLAGSTFPAATADLAGGVGRLPATAPVPAPKDDAIEIQVKADSKVDDGRYNNNGWLQELPDSITKLTWDNVALVSHKTADRLGLYKSPEGKARKQFKNDEGHYDLIEIEVQGRKVTMPAMISLGQAENVVTVTLGYGRSRVGRVGTGTGFDVYPLLTSTSGFILPGAKVRETQKQAYLLAFAQMYGFMEGRNLAREGTMEEFAHNQDFAMQQGMDAHIPPNVSIYKTPPYQQLSEHQWGMAIDLNLCTGCGACTVACQSENNIPIVGKIQVDKGREMHWLRMDRYYTTTDVKRPLLDDEPQIIFQPVACVHCENAPCETVCPVNATIHSEDGLNVMAYNRCIGTRYCANNCPYKARRFNFFDFNDRPVGKIEFAKDEKVPFYKRITEGRDKLELGPLTKKGMEESLKLSKNPNVTVRMRGVMEKCTYCVQRIETAKIDQRIKAKDSANTKIPTDVVTTACQDACSTGSIVFGDIADKNSEVVKLKLQKRNYRIIEYLNTQARTSYLARVRNPNKEMPDYVTHYNGDDSHSPYGRSKGRRAVDELGHPPHDDHGGGDHGKGHGATNSGEHMPGANAAGSGVHAPAGAHAPAAPAAHSEPAHAPAPAPAGH
jgi:molybdopterin-containing oxidoreductase family iron-sulfur binding subunit